MRESLRFALTVLLTSHLIGCASYTGPAPISDLGRDYSSSSRGEYRGSYYKVREGDTLYFISYLTDKDVNELIRFNSLSPPYTIYPGQKLNLWRPSYRAPQYGRSVSPSMAAKANPSSTSRVVNQTIKGAVSTSAIVTQGKSSTKVLTKPSLKSSENGQYPDIVKNKSDADIKVAGKSIEPSQAKGYGKSTSKNNVNSNIRDTHSTNEQKVKHWLWPTKGRIINKFTTGDQGNKGIDIAGQRGQAVVSTAAGSVVYSGNALRGYGNLVIIKHNDNYLSAYAHNDKLLVKEGQNVIAGQKIATMGSSGTGSVKLHFEIRYQGKSVNPNRYLP